MTAGKRYALSHSRILIHQPWGGAQGTAADIEIQAEEILEARKILNKILADTHGPSDGGHRARHGARQLHVRGRGASEYGLIDEVLEPKKSPRKGDRPRRSDSKDA